MEVQINHKNHSFIVEISQIKTDIKEISIPDETTRYSKNGAQYGSIQYEPAYRRYIQKTQITKTVMCPVCEYEVNV